MDIADKMKRLRRFRNISQRELGEAIGLKPGRPSESRIGQYEISFRAPKKDLVARMAAAFDVSPYALFDYDYLTDISLFEHLMWLDEETPNTLEIFPISDGKKDAHVTSSSDDARPLANRFGISFNSSLLNYYLSGWHDVRCAYRNGEMSESEYFEWKLKWPLSQIERPHAKPDVDPRFLKERITTKEFFNLSPAIQECFCTFIFYMKRSNCIILEMGFFGNDRKEHEYSNYVTVIFSGVSQTTMQSPYMDILGIVLVPEELKQKNSIRLHLPGETKQPYIDVTAQHVSIYGLHDFCDYDDSIGSRYMVMGENGRSVPRQNERQE